MGRIMQLPDCCFGRRWPIGVAQEQEAVGAYYDISEFALPERCVVWGLYVWLPVYSTTAVEITLSLGDQLPTTDAQFDALEVLFRDIGFIVGGRRTIRSSRSPSVLTVPLRMPVTASGRRLVGRFAWGASIANSVYTIIVVSSIPTEAPDWLLSDYHKSL